MCYNHCMWQVPCFFFVKMNIVEIRWRIPSSNIQKSRSQGHSFDTITTYDDFGLQIRCTECTEETIRGRNMGRYQYTAENDDYEADLERIRISRKRRKARKRRAKRMAQLGRLSARLVILVIAGWICLNLLRSNAVAAHTDGTESRRKDPPFWYFVPR